MTNAILYIFDTMQYSKYNSTGENNMIYTTIKPELELFSFFDYMILYLPRIVATTVMPF